MSSYLKRKYIGKKLTIKNLGDYEIAFSGYITNLKELNLDIKQENKNIYDLIVLYYEKYGEDFFKYFDGCFFIALYNKIDDKLILGVDRYGVKKLYYYYVNNEVVFSESLKEFDNYKNYKKEFNDKLLNLYMCFNMNPGNETFYKNIDVLSFGKYIVFNDLRFKLNTYYELEFNKNNKKDENVIIDNLKKCVSDLKDYGSFLSSGVDSSFIVSLLKPAETFTVGYKEKQYNESDSAKKLCKHLKINNTEVIVDKKEFLKSYLEVVKYMDEPIANPSLPALFIGMKGVSKKVDTILSGEGADELFGGYNSYKDILKYSKYKKIPYFIRHFFAIVASTLPSIRGLNFIYRNGIKYEDFYIGSNRIFRDKESIGYLVNKDVIKTKDFTKELYNKISKCDDLEKSQIVDYNYNLIKDYIQLLEISSRYYDVQVRYPFLNKEIFDLALGLKIEDKVSKVKTKLYLREVGSSIIPLDISNNRKIGFSVPLKEWIYEVYYDDIKTAFNYNFVDRIFNKKKINKLLEKKNKADYKKVWTIYTMIVWYKYHFYK